MYLSLLDPADTTVTFEHSGQTAYIYFMRWNEGADRDLMRRPIRFELRSPDAGVAQDATHGSCASVDRCDESR